jgi:hypothetical protein
MRVATDPLDADRPGRPEAGKVTMNYSFTFQFEAGKMIFRRIGTHDILKKEY